MIGKTVVKMYRMQLKQHIEGNSYFHGLILVKKKAFNSIDLKPHLKKLDKEEKNETQISKNEGKIQS